MHSEIKIYFWLKKNEEKKTENILVNDNILVKDKAKLERTVHSFQKRVAYRRQCWAGGVVVAWRTMERGYRVLILQKMAGFFNFEYSCFYAGSMGLISLQVPYTYGETS